MDRFRAMQVFSRVAERGSFVRAGEELGYSHGMASAIVKDLEAHLGVQLIRRTTRRLRLTEEGHRYLERAKAILSDVVELEEDIGAGERTAKGRLRIQIPVGLGRLVVAPALTSLAASYPELTVHMLSRNSFPDFVGEDIDAAIFIGEVPDSDLVARPLGRIPFLTSATPEYLARAGVPHTPDDLDLHNCIGILSSETRRGLAWRFERDGRLIFKETSGNLCFEASEPAVEAALRGAGVLQMIAFLVADHIRERGLRPVLTDWLYPGVEMQLIYPRHSHLPRKLRVFESFVRKLVGDYARLWRLRVPEALKGAGSATPEPS